MKAGRIFPAFFLIKKDMILDENQGKITVLNQNQAKKRIY